MDTYFHDMLGMTLGNGRGALIKNFSVDKPTVQSFISDLNDGSHKIMDCSDEKIAQSLDIFKKLFEENGQIGHYNAMMKMEE